MTFTFSIQDLALFIVFCLIVVVAVYLVITLSSLIKLIKKLDGLVEANSENVGKTIAVLPEVARNVNEVALSVKGNLDKADSVIGALGGSFSEAAATVSEGTEKLFAFINIISNVVKIIMNLFSRSDNK